MNNKNITSSKITPQAVEAEKAVLSAMMIDEGSAAEVMDILRAECFYDSANREIFSSIRKLFINFYIACFVSKHKIGKGSSCINT